MPDDRYCIKCGLQLPENATYCPNCGTAVSRATQPGSESSSPPLTPREYRRRYRAQRRDEKYEGQEKSEKGEKHEKGGSGSLVGPLTGGLILIWLGISFYLSQTGYLEGNWWAFFLIGIGGILVLQSALLSSRANRLIVGPAIGGAFLVILGAAFVFGEVGNLWPLILVVIGVGIVASGIISRRKTTPSP